MTRWAEDDLTGRLIRSENEPKADKWEKISFPALLGDEENPVPVWPEYWNLEELEKVKASISIRNWSAQYMQNPTSEEGAILKREWWQPWSEDIPALKHVIQSYDTAFSKRETADYSAITTWGIFKPHDGSPDAIMLIDAIKGKWDFPELKMVALDQYKYWQPETVIIEAKASGQSLLQELRRMGIPVMDYTPGRGQDKHSRVNACSPIFESKQVWYPRDEHWAHEVIEECAAFSSWRA
jgi:predicted phage terminase large subunit-like protein